MKESYHLLMMSIIANLNNDIDWFENQIKIENQKIAENIIILKAIIKT